jgi:hypothetical protein
MQVYLWALSAVDEWLSCSRELGSTCAVAMHVIVLDHAPVHCLNLD